MKSFSNEYFGSQFDHGKRLTLESMQFENCTFSNCILSMTNDISKRSTVRDTHLKDCELQGCGVGPAIFEYCSIDGLKTSDLQIIWGALFNQVSLSGVIGKLKINQMVDPMRPEAQPPFDKFRMRYYSNVEWALDISNARFKSFDIVGVPARLFKLDGESQAIVTRERALQPGWQQKVSSWNTLWPFMIRLFLKDGDADTVLVAPLAAPKRERDDLMRGLKELRDLGVAEPAT